MTYVRVVALLIFGCVILPGATLVFPGFSGSISGFTILDLSGGAPGAVSFYYLGSGEGQIEVFDFVNGTGNSLGSSEILPATSFLTPAGIGFTGIARSLVFNITGEITIEQLTYGNFVIPEPGTFIVVATGLLLACLIPRNRVHRGSRPNRRI